MPNRGIKCDYFRRMQIDHVNRANHKDEKGYPPSPFMLSLPSTPPHCHKHKHRHHDHHRSKHKCKGKFKHHRPHHLPHHKHHRFHHSPYQKHHRSHHFPHHHHIINDILGPFHHKHHAAFSCHAALPHHGFFNHPISTTTHEGL